MTAFNTSAYSPVSLEEKKDEGHPAHVDDVDCHTECDFNFNSSFLYNV